VGAESSTRVGPALWAGLFLAAFATGCFLFQSHEIERLDVRESDLPPDEVARKSAEADRLYEPPRTVQGVETSFDIALEAISASNGYRALWQAARAADWLAEHLDDEKRQEYFARKGIAAGRESIRLAPDRVESWYYLALNLARLSDLRKTPHWVKEMAGYAERAREIDERFDRAGPHRFLGLLNLSTEGNVVVGYGDFDAALDHLRRAAELFPDAENLTNHARALVADEDYAAARKQLEAALGAPVPPGHEADGPAWIADARKLLGEIAGK